MRCAAPGIPWGVGGSKLQIPRRKDRPNDRTSNRTTRRSTGRPIARSFAHWQRRSRDDAVVPHVKNPSAVLEFRATAPAPILVESRARGARKAFGATTSANISTTAKVRSDEPDALDSAKHRRGKGKWPLLHPRHIKQREGRANISSANTLATKKAREGCA